MEFHELEVNIENLNSSEKLLLTWIFCIVGRMLEGCFSLYVTIRSIASGASMRSIFDIVLQYISSMTMFIFSMNLTDYLETLCIPIILLEEDSLAPNMSN